MEIRQESSLVHFFRATVLVIALVAVPGTAVCWNLLPKDIFHREKDLDKSSSKNHVELSVLKNDEGYDFADNLVSFVENWESPPASPSELFSHDLLQSEKSDSVILPPLKKQPSHDLGMIKTMSHIDSGERSVHSISTDFTFSESAAIDPAIWMRANDQKLIESETPDFSVIKSQLTQQYGFPDLEKELKILGAKYYRLEKWGSRGDLFRFSCYVSPSTTYQYQKYFQAIDSDELSVMRRVVEDIKHWKEKL